MYPHRGHLHGLEMLGVYVGAVGGLLTILVAQRVSSSPSNVLGLEGICRCQQRYGIQVLYQGQSTGGYLSAQPRDCLSRPSPTIVIHQVPTAGIYSLIAAAENEEYAALTRLCG